VLAGGMTFLTLRRAIDRLEKPTERALALGYAATFFGVVLPTSLAMYATFTLNGNFNR